MQREWSQALSSGAQWQNKTQAGTQDISSKHQEIFFHCEDDQALAQVGQKGCGVSLEILKSHTHGQLSLGEPAWAGRSDKMTPRCSFQLEPFCERNSASTDTSGQMLSLLWYSAKRGGELVRLHMNVSSWKRIWGSPLQKKLLHTVLSALWKFHKLPVNSYLVCILLISKYFNSICSQ